MASSFRNSALDTPTIDTGAVAVDRLDVTGASRSLFAPACNQGNAKGPADDHNTFLTTASWPVFSQNTFTSPPWVLRDVSGKATADQSYELLPGSKMLYKHQHAGFADQQQQPAPRQLQNQAITASKLPASAQARLSPDIDSYNSYESEQTADRRSQGSPYFESPIDAVQAFKGAFADSSSKSLPANRQSHQQTQQAQQAKQAQQAQQAQHALQAQQALQSQQADFTQQTQQAQQAQQLQRNMTTQSMFAVQAPQGRSGSAGKPQSMYGQTHPSGSEAPISNSQRQGTRHSYPHPDSQFQEHMGPAGRYTHQQQGSEINTRGLFNQGMQAQMTRPGTVYAMHPMHPGQMHVGQKRPQAMSASWDQPQACSDRPSGYFEGDPSWPQGGPHSKIIKRAGASFDPAATSSMPPDASNDLECSEQMQPDAFLQDSPLDLFADLFADPFASPPGAKAPPGTRKFSPILQDSPIPLGHCFPNQKYPKQSPVPNQATLLGHSPMHAFSPSQLQQQTVSSQPSLPQHPAQPQLYLPQSQPQKSSQPMLADSQHQAASHMAHPASSQQKVVPLSAQTASSQQRLVPLSASTVPRGSLDFEDFVMGMMGFLDEPSRLPSARPVQRQASLHKPAAHPSPAQRSAPQHPPFLAAQPSHAPDSLPADSAAWYARALATQSADPACQPSSSPLLAMVMSLANQQTAACHAPTPAAHPPHLRQSCNKLQQDEQLGNNQSNAEHTGRGCPRGPPRGATGVELGCKGVPSAAAQASLTDHDSKSALSWQQGADSSSTMQVTSQGTGWDTGSFSTQLHNVSLGSFSKGATGSQLSEDDSQLSDRQTSKAESEQAEARPIRQPRVKRLPKYLADDASEAVAAPQGASRGSKGRAEGSRDANAKRAKRAGSKPLAPVPGTQLKPFDGAVGTISEEFFAQLNIKLGTASKAAPAATSGQSAAPSKGSVRVVVGGVPRAVISGSMSGSAIKLSNNPAAWPLSHAIKRKCESSADITSQEQLGVSDFADLMLP